MRIICPEPNRLQDMTLGIADWVVGYAHFSGREKKATEALTPPWLG